MVLAVEAREGLNTQDIAERLVVATVHLGIERLMGVIIRVW